MNETVQCAPIILYHRCKTFKYFKSGASFRKKKYLLMLKRILPCPKLDVDVPALAELPVLCPPKPPPKFD